MVCLLCLSPEIFGEGYAVPTTKWKSLIVLSPPREVEEEVRMLSSLDRLFLLA